MKIKTTLLKAIAILLIFFTVLSFTSCKQKVDPTPKPEQPTETEKPDEENPDKPDNPQTPTESGILKNSYFWGKWTRMDNGVEYEITESEINTSDGKKLKISSATGDTFTCEIGTFEKETDSIMRIDKIPVFRNGGSNIEYKVTLVGFANNNSKAATATTVLLKGQKVKNKTETYPSYSEENSSDDNGIVTLHSPVSGTQNTLQITASDGSIVTAVVAPKNSGENVGTIPVAPKGMYSLKVLGEVQDNKSGYLYAGTTYNMNVKIQNISEVEAETSLVTMESESPYLSISGEIDANISTFPGGQSKTLKISFSANGFEDPFIDTSIKVTFEDTSLARNVWIDRIPLRIFKEKEKIIIKAVSTENNEKCALNGFVMYPDGNSQHFTIPHNQKKTVEVPSFPAQTPYMISFCGATTGAELSDSTEMKYSIGINVEPPDISGTFTIDEITSYEPNDTEADAKSLGSSTKIKTYLKKGDTNFYKIIVNPYGTETTYTVEHQKENLSGGYDTVDTETLTSTVGAITEAVAKLYEGFEAQEITQQTVAENGSTKVIIKYNRKLVTFTFNAAGGRFDDKSQISTQQGKYGTETSYPTPKKSNCTFLCYTPDVPKTYPFEDMEFTARWSSSVTAQISIISIKNDSFTSDSISISATESNGFAVLTASDGYEKYKWNIDDTTLSSTSSTVSIPLSEISAGYHTVTVEATDSNGKRFFTSFILEKNGNAETFATSKITFNAAGGTFNDGSETRTQEGLCGTEISAPIPTKDGCTFLGWTPELKSYPDKDTEVTARWAASVTTEVVIKNDSFTSDSISVSAIESNGTAVLTASGDYERYKWNIDGTALDSTSSTVSVPLSEISAGYHTVTVEATDSGGKRFFTTFILEKYE